MKLLTKALIKRFAQIGRQEGTKDPIVVAKFFNPYGSGTWYATEYYPKDNCCFGYVIGLGCDEWGYFSIDEMEAVRVTPFGLSLERDKWFQEGPFSKALGK